MSRIDEALARARTTDPERLAPPASPPEPDGRIEFPVEAEEVPAGIPAAAEVFDRQQSATPASDAIIEVDGDVTALPGAEKLMLHSQETTSVPPARGEAADGAGGKGHAARDGHERVSR